MNPRSPSPPLQPFLEAAAGNVPTGCGTWAAVPIPTASGRLVLEEEPLLLPGAARPKAEGGRGWGGSVQAPWVLVPCCGGGRGNSHPHSPVRGAHTDDGHPAAVPGQ